MPENPESNPFHADRDEFLIDELADDLVDNSVDYWDEPDGDRDFEPLSAKQKGFETNSADRLPPKLLSKSVLPQRFMLWAIACATVPTCIIAGFAYQINYQSSRDAEIRTQEIRAVALADSLNNFVLRQYEGAKELSSQLVVSELSVGSKVKSGKSANAKTKSSQVNSRDRQKQLQKQISINRLNQSLNQYRSSSKAISSVSIHDLSGNLILQSTTDSPTKNLDPAIVRKVIKFNSPLVNQPVNQPINQSVSQSTNKNNLGNQYLIQFVVPILNPKTKRIQAILASQVPIASIRTSFTTGDYVITDADNQRYLYTSNPVKPSMGLNLSSNRDRANSVSVRTPSLQGLPDLNWQVIVDFEPVPTYSYITVLGTCILILVVAIALITYLAARRLSDRLILVSNVMDSISEGKEPQLSKLSEEGNDEIAQILANTNRLTQRFQDLSDRQNQTVDRLQRRIAKGIGALHSVIRSNGEDPNKDLSSRDLEAIAAHLQASFQAALVKKETEINLLHTERERHHLQTIEALLIKEREIAQKQIEVKLLQEQLTELSDRTVSQLDRLNAELESTSAQYNQILQEIVNQSEQKQAQLEQKDCQIQELETQLSAMIAKNTDIDNQLQLSISEASDRARELANYSISSQNIELMTKQILNLREAIAIGAKKAKRLSESSQKISKIIDLIHEIGIEANFLTVNAGIKANREHNHDFGVFSDQVGKIANMSVSAMQEMEQLAKNIQTETREVMDNLELGTTQIAEATKLMTGVKSDLQNAEEEVRRRI